MNPNEMSHDMSMFRKMKDRITDEVSSATNKLQNMQIIDQLASSISQQIKNEMVPNQVAPEPHDSCPNSANVPVNSQFSLIDDGPVGGYNEEDELNSEISPQHQLFDEHSIKKLSHSGLRPSHFDNNNGIIANNHNGTVPRPLGSVKENVDNSQSVINIYELSSDIEDGLDQVSDTNSKDDGLDVEIDLLSDKPIDNYNDTSYNGKASDSYLPFYKTKYRGIVHDLRKIYQELETERSKSQLQRQELTNKLTALRMELDSTKQQLNLNQHDSLNSISTSVSENDRSSGRGSPQPSSKTGTKLRDLEKLLAKCKESLKLKNSQIKELKESLNEVEKYKDYNQELKRELAELKESHEYWTVSIAENKRVMHQEIEEKNNEMERLRGDINDLQSTLTDVHNDNKHLKSTIQDLESRLVRTSAAHQKERESLTKQLTAAKNNAIKQIQKESERNIERVKLDLEKSIEALKHEILNKDEMIIKNAQKQQQMHDKNLSLSSELDAANKKLQEQLKLTEEAVNNLYSEKDKCSEMIVEIDKLRGLSLEDNYLRAENEQLSDQVKNLEVKLKSANAVKCELDKRLSELDKIPRAENCENCEALRTELRREKEQFQQELHELNTRLNLMTTANDDQEKEIKSLTNERDALSESFKGLRDEFEELYKKNESLARVIRENETDMQSQQEQLDKLGTVEHELDSLKRENTALLEKMSQYKSELDERTRELNSLKNHDDVINDQLSKLKTDIKNTQSIIDELRKDKDFLSTQNQSHSKQRKDFEEQLVVGILSVMKNLETPNMSPGSDKSYGSSKQDSDSKEERSLPNPISLVEELSSLALDRSNAYMTATQRLQAVLLENTMIGEELRRLKDELNNLNRENSLATQTSMDEFEKLRTENQALIHDQQAYDDRITSLEEEVEKLNKKLSETRQSAEIVPDSTEFEYLKNIVYQFMLGRETLVLARVIAAVFKFDKSQIEQICKIQESLQPASRQNT